MGEIGESSTGELRAGRVQQLPEGQTCEGVGVEVGSRPDHEPAARERPSRDGRRPDVRPVDADAGGVVPRPVDLPAAGVGDHAGVGSGEAVQRADPDRGDPEGIRDCRRRHDADTQPGERARPDTDHDPLRGAGPEHLLDTDGEQLAVPAPVDHDLLGEDGRAPLDDVHQRGRDRGGGGVQDERPHVSPCARRPARA